MLVASVDYPNRRIYLSAATADSDLDTLAIYREVRALRRTAPAHRQFRPIIEAGGNLTKIPGVSYTPAYVRLLHGCRLVPFNGSHKLRLVRDTFTDDGLAGRDCFDRTPLGSAVEVDIDVDYQEIEIRQVAISGNAFTVDDIAAAVWSHAHATVLAGKLADAWARLGLDPSRPLSQDQTSIRFGDVLLAISESAGTVIVTRQ